MTGAFELFEHFEVHEGVLLLEECIEDYFDVAVFILLSTTKLKTVFDEVLETFFELSGLLGAVCQ